MSFIDIEFEQWNENATLGWLQGVNTTGCYLTPPSLPTNIRDVSHLPQKWKAVQYLTLSSTSDENIEIKLIPVDGYSLSEIKYQIGDASNWLTYN